MADVFLYGSVIDASVDALMDVFAGEIMSKTTIFSLIHFLVVVMPWPMTTMIAASVPTTAIMTSHLVAVVVRRVIAAMRSRSW